MPFHQGGQGLAAPLHHPQGQGGPGELRGGGLELLQVPGAIPEPGHLLEHQPIGHGEHQQVEAWQGGRHHTSGHQPLGAAL